MSGVERDLIVGSCGCVRRGHVLDRIRRLGNKSGGRRFFAAIFLNAEREKKIGSFGYWI